MKTRNMFEEKIILEQTVTRANILLKSELYNQEPELAQLIDSFKEDEKNKRLSITELHLYADDFEYWMERLYKYDKESSYKKESNKNNLLNKFRSDLESNLKNLNGSAYGLDDEELNIIINLAVSQCSTVLDKVRNRCSEQK
ncbi:hypothetical protein AALT52_01485 [Ligilactobacillus faecis]|uniref:Uncharacterized protein n=1 Tax=Ligilactobacillus faecis TaxID=762833 RepID=A0ABV4DM69_9LACO